MNKRKKLAIYTPIFLLVVLFFFLGVGLEIWRWHVFQSLTHNQVSFWTYIFLFNNR
jgi:hypothetical protein